MVNVVAPSANETAGSDCSPSFWDPAEVTWLESPMAFTSNQGDERPSSRRCAASRMRDFGWLPFGLRDIAERRQQRLRVFQPHGVRVFLIAVPIGARLTLGEIPGDRERRIPQESRFSIGSEGLPRLPELGVTFDGEGLQSA